MDLLKKLSLTMLISVSLVCAAENENYENRESLSISHNQNSGQDVANKYLNEEIKENSSTESSIQKQESNGSFKEDIDLNEQLSKNINDAIKKLHEINLLEQKEKIPNDDHLFEVLKLLESGKTDDAITKLRECQQNSNDDEKDLIQQILKDLEENNKDKQPKLNYSIIEPNIESNDNDKK